MNNWNDGLCGCYECEANRMWNKSMTNTKIVPFANGLNYAAPIIPTVDVSAVTANARYFILLVTKYGVSRVGDTNGYKLWDDAEDAVEDLVRRASDKGTHYLIVTSAAVYSKAEAPVNRKTF